ncbi:hypothetical protein EVAR_33816_1 [Eumeta japonica]|uniref:Uncharacterized protein n=1 Tax=Eumeta variegata TaxID=151549 RepID=A0A4C1VCE2_EUMVA|nr:hypothetical protein EVAR_33816_1 [Eumeta japonica]
MLTKKDNVVSWDTSHVLVHECMSIYYALAGWSGNRERRDERTKRKREKDKVRSRSKIPISSKPAVRNFVPITKFQSKSLDTLGSKVLVLRPDGGVEALSRMRRSSAQRALRVLPEARGECYDTTLIKN